MRITIITFALVVVSGPAFALNVRPTTRADHKSLDIVIRRLERAKGRADEDVLRDIVAALYHLEPMRERRGGSIGWGAIEVGSEDEASLICTQHGYANTYVERGEVLKDIYDGAVNWLWNRILAFCLGCLPWIPMVAFLYLNRAKIAKAFKDSEEEHVALRKKIEQEFDKEERRRRFNDPVADRGHARLKAEGKL